MRLYRGVSISHDEEDVRLIQSKVEAFQPDFSIELGTANGGLTLAIHDAFPSAPIATFDNRREELHAPVRKLTVQGFVRFFCWDILSAEAVPLLHYVRNMRRRKFLYCDNGGKVREMLMYAKYLVGGDLVGVHDWGTEIHTDYDRMDEKWQAIVGREKVEKLKIMLEADFELVGEGRKTRLWIKR